ncbi:MAG: hypothetical protein KHZ72_04460 [Lachnospiraceae bacterium]|nr:hypothetical protein [Lachnospiraceae bacterium]
MKCREKKEKKKRGRRCGAEKKNEEKTADSAACGGMRPAVHGKRIRGRRKFIVEISAYSYYYMDIKERDNV